VQKLVEEVNGPSLPVLKTDVEASSRA